MNIGFFIQGKEDSLHWKIASYMIESARRLMPEAGLHQLTDSETPALKIPGQNLHPYDGLEVIRIEGEMPMAVRRMKHHSSLEGEWVFVDTDVIFQRDVREVFSEPFDVALTDRIGTYMENTDYGKQQPYNMGVTFSRNNKFWKYALDKLLNYPSRYQEWEGDQMVVCGMAASEQTRFDIVAIPGRIYNFTPKTKDEDCSHASIVHYKGNRKAWINL